MYKILALDMDGTLLNSHKKISPATVEGINKLTERGVQIVISSGRCLAEMKDFREDLKNVRYGILTSGGLIYDFFDEKIITYDPVPFEDCIKIIDVGIEEDAMIHILTIHHSVASQRDIDRMNEFDMSVYRDMFNKICVKPKDLKQYAFEHKEHVMKVNLYHHNKESRNNSVEKLKHLNLELVFAEETSLESSPKNVTKGYGLIELCKYLNVDIKDTVAIGDAQNDLEILHTAGYSVAMGNGIEEVKLIADFVTTDNDHDGVLFAIKKIFGGD